MRKPGSVNRWLWISIAIILIIFFIFRIFFASSDRSGFGDKVGVIRLEGVILSADEIVSQFTKFADRSDVKAIVLRVNSGGGVVGASQEIYEKVNTLKGKLPVVTSVSNAAASGAYYAALGSEVIVANKGSIVGSIGVILDYPVAADLLDKIGLRMETIKSGELKDSGSPSRPVNDTDREYFQDVVDNLHEQFVEDVASARNLELDEVHRLANGRVFTGNQAVKLGLIDTIGTFEDAIAIAGKLGGIEGTPKKIEVKKQRRSFFDVLFSEIQQNTKSWFRVEPAFRWQ